MADMSDAFEQVEQNEQSQGAPSVGKGGEEKNEFANQDSNDESENSNSSENESQEIVNEDQLNEDSGNEDSTNESSEDLSGDSDKKPSDSKTSVEELTGGKYKSEQELIDKIKEYEEKNTTTTAEIEELKGKAVELTPYAKKVYELEKKGLKPTPKLLSDLEVDWDGMDVKSKSDAMKMVEMKMRLDSPDLDDEDVSYLVNKKYGYNEEARREALMDKYDDDEEKVNSIINREKEDQLKELSISAKAALPKLKEYQSSLTEVGDEGGNAEEDRNVYLNDLSKSMGELDNVTVKYGKEDVSVEVSKEIKEKVSNTLENLVTNPSKFWEQVGHVSGLAQKLAISETVGELMAEAGTKSSAQARKKEADELTNQKPHSAQNSSNTTDEEVEEARSYARQMGVDI